MTEKIELKVNIKNEGERLDKFISLNLNFSRAQIQKLIKKNLIKVNNGLKKANFILKKDNLVDISLPKPKENKVVPKNLNLKIVYKDRNIIAFDKPAGISVHPSNTEMKPTMVSDLLFHFPTLAKLDKLRPGIVHRLDKDTSGILVVARNKKVQKYLRQQWKNKKVKKCYIGLVQGILKPEKGIIEAPISRSKANRQKMAISLPETGKMAITKYEVKKYYSGTSLLLIFPKTGRMHQIRVHLASIGHPIVGDKKYGGNKTKGLLKRQFLHAASLELKMPNGKILKLESKLSPDLKDFLKKLK